MMVAEPDRLQTAPAAFAASIRVVHATGSTTAVAVNGECDLTTAPELTRVAQQAIAEGRNVIIDLSEVSFLDVAMVRSLLTAHAAALERGCELVVQLGENTFAERVLSITGADRKLATAVTRRAAMELAVAPAY